MSPTRTPKAREARRAVAWFFSRVFVVGFAAPLLWAACKLWYGFDVDRSHARAQGFDVRRHKGPVLIAPNHVQYLDAALVGLAVWPKVPRFVSLEENMHIPVAGAILRAARTMSVGEGLDGIVALGRAVRDAVAHGESVCVYPEGELETYRRGLAPFHRGVFYGAARLDVPVVPVVLRQKAGQGVQRLRHKPSFTVVVGPAMWADKAAGSYKAQSVELMERVRAQMERMLEGPVDGRSRR